VLLSKAFTPVRFVRRFSWSTVTLGQLITQSMPKRSSATAFQIQSADQIAPTLKKAFDTPGPVLIGMHVDYQDNARLFEDVY
jgi:acetolactate synthase I/II/III large subunit